REGGGSSDGDHFTARWTYSAPRRAELPVMIAALSRRMLELAGEISDGVVLWLCSPRYVREHVVPAIKAGCERAGRSPDAVEIVAAVPACLTTDRAGAQEVFRQTITR